MSSGAARARSAARGSISTTVETDDGKHWHAIGLLELLVPFQPFLVQHSLARDAEAAVPSAAEAMAESER